MEFVTRVTYSRTLAHPSRIVLATSSVIWSRSMNGAASNSRSGRFLIFREESALPSTASFCAFDLQ